jgi:hypothetical protein
MKQKMIHRLAKPTSINHNQAFSPEIIDDENLTSSGSPSKKRYSRWSLRSPNAFPRERSGPMGRKNPIIRSHLKGILA